MSNLLAKVSRGFLGGLTLSAVTVVISYGLAVQGFAHVYYLAQIVPIFLVGYLLLAWLIYLRRDDFLSFVGSQRAPAVQTLGNVEPGETQGISEDKLAGREVSDRVRIKDGLVQRRGDDESSEDFWHNMIYVFLWSAIQLTVVSIILYQRFGIGAGF
jgi:hypothetical protein